MLERIIYRCKNCNWKKSINASWMDIKPKKCPNKKCKTSFLLKSELLEIKNPSEPALKNIEKVLEESPDKEEALEDPPKEEKPKRDGRRK